MPTYALLGGTGATGTAIIRALLARPPPNLTLNIFIRSRSKLDKIFPDLAKTQSFKVNIIEGVPSDATSLQQCLKGADVIFACVATNEAKAGISLVEDTSKSVIMALKVLKKESATYRTPTIILLRSASLNAKLNRSAPWLAHYMAAFCFHHIYSDIARASSALEAAKEEDPTLLEWVYVDPPSIHDSEGTTPTGVELLTGEEQGKGQRPELSYADLGSAFVEVAGRRGEFAGRAVGPSATGEVKQTWGVLMGYMVGGLRSRVWG